jgi:hypothetical protein
VSVVPHDVEAARTALAESPGEPVWLDVPVVATRVESESGPAKIVLQLATDDGDPVGTAHVYTNEWWPGTTAGRQRFSHYFTTLRRCFDGLERANRPQTMRLQLLRAVRASTPAGRQITVLLKFVIAPEYALSGTTMESIYGCPLAHFYERFIGVSRDVLRDRSEPSFTRGSAIHEGYQRAADARLAGASTDQVHDAYLEGVGHSWVANFAYLLLDRPKSGPRKLHRAPIEAAPHVVRLCESSWPDGTELELLQERLAHSPSRGLSGRIDRIERQGKTIKLTEVKTGGSFGAELDRITGQRHAGGIQALVYREVLRSRQAEAPDAAIEELGEDGSSTLPLDAHPVLTRAGATLSASDERALDLWVQSRNVGYIAATGLLTGYDRYQLDAISRINRYLGSDTGDFDLYSSAAPCQICTVGSRGVCQQTRTSVPTPLFNLFRFAPSELFSYWTWFHRQLLAENQAGSEWLYHLSTTTTSALQNEGVTLVAMELVHLDGMHATLRRDHPLETRIREDDRVLLTPNALPPGDVLSVEGNVETMGANEITIRLWDRLPGGVVRFRIDDVGRHDIANWQTQGLTDFLVTAMDATPARGRAITLAELPRLAQTLLGHQDAVTLPDDPAVPSTVTGLNADQRRAVGAAMSLNPASGAPLLVQGPPGTGKTSMIAELVRAIAVDEFWRDGAASEERPLLLLANSHRAVDEMVGRVVTRYPDLAPYVVRVGNVRSTTEPAVRNLVLNERIGVQGALDIDQMRDSAPERLVELIRRGNAIHDGAMIFAATLGGATRPELRGLRFRTVIVDETGQATEPAALQALRHLPTAYRGRLILVGDQQQLPPVVPESDDSGTAELPDELQQTGLTGSDTLRTSLFERLVRRYPERLITLSQQYRMADPICTLISDTFYNGLLTPGTDEVAARHAAETFTGLGLPVPGSIITTTPPVVLLDTSADPAARDSIARGGGEDARENGREADLIAQLIQELFAGVPTEKRAPLAASMGVISPYRRQNNRIRRSLAMIDPWIATSVRVDTVDRFQGGERDIIFVSLTNSNSAAVIGSLHADWRRMNVALSRARRSLVIVGDRRTFTRQGDASEEMAKERYRRLFSVLDRLATEQRAQVIQTAGLRAHG